MEITNTVTVAATRSEAWAFLADAERLSGCLRGMEAVELQADGLGFGGPASLNLGAQALRFPTWVRWIEQHPPEGGKLRAGAQVGRHEFTGEGTVALVEAAAGTVMHWQLHIILPLSLEENRMVAQLVHNITMTVLSGFFACVEERLNEVSAG
jgi:carbon monoxide dehydrogenase subunit G